MQVQHYSLTSNSLLQSYITHQAWRSALDAADEPAHGVVPLATFTFMYANRHINYVLSGKLLVPDSGCHNAYVGMRLDMGGDPREKNSLGTPTTCLVDYGNGGVPNASLLTHICRMLHMDDDAVRGVFNDHQRKDPSLVIQALANVTACGEPNRKVYGTFIYL